MEYYYNRLLKDTTFEVVVEKIIAALREEGFGILTEIDIKATLKKKLDVDFYNYIILGACNPEFAHKALLMEDKIGTMLPCNIIVQEKLKGEIEVSAINPTVSMQAIDNSGLSELAAEVSAKLERSLRKL